MANILQPVRGTRDIIGDESDRHLHVIKTAKDITSLYGFSEWQTPIFEDTKVFSRTLGETSDVVTKEMYTFDDRGGDSITLRPEGTAGVCRALITNGLTQTLPQKVFYQGPMFRYERPQKGRYRQFQQVGIELLGPSEALADAEAISCGWKLLEALGIDGSVELQINTLGDAESRNNYRAALVNYFERHEADLSEESKVRLAKNPLRILDSKDPGDQDICANAPIVHNYLTDIAQSHYEKLEKYLRIFDIPFKSNPRIVRGLDYYNHTAFEFVTTALGAQGTVLAGGRYDGLVEQMGGPNVPGVGWAAGVDRLGLLLERLPATDPLVVIIPRDETPESEVLKLLKMLRDEGIKSELGFANSVKRHNEKALRSKARIALLLPKDSLAEGKVVVYDLECSRLKYEPALRREFAREVSINDLPDFLKNLRDSLKSDSSMIKFLDRLKIALPKK